MEADPIFESNRVGDVERVCYYNDSEIDFELVGPDVMLELLPLLFDV